MQKTPSKIKKNREKQFQSTVKEKNPNQRKLFQKQKNSSKTENTVVPRMSDILKVRMSSDPAGCVLCGVLWRPESSDIWGPSLTSLQNLPVKVRTVLTLLYIHSDIWGPSLTSLQNLPVKVRTGLTLLLLLLCLLQQKRIDA